MPPPAQVVEAEPQLTTARGLQMEPDEALVEKKDAEPKEKAV